MAWRGTIAFKLNNYLMRYRQLSANLNWKGGYPVPLNSALQLSLGQNADGRLELFYRGTNDRIYHMYQKSVPSPSHDGSDWSGENKLGVSAYQVTVGKNADGKLGIFYRGTNTKLYHMSQLQPNGSIIWSGETWLGDYTREVAVAQNKDGRLEIFYLASPGDSRFFHNWQVTPNGGWSGRYQLPQ